MKRRVICIFTLIFWMITLSTVLSIRIEQLMTPTISLVEAEDGAGDISEIPADALTYDDMGMHLYRTREGSGWEKGIRVYEEDMSRFTIQGDKLQMEYGGTYIRYATRTLRVGEVVQKAEAFQYADDQWVAIYPEGIPSFTLTDTDASVETQTETAMVISVPEANVPFMEDRARSQINIEKDEFYYYQAPTSTVYSLNDLKQFMDSMILLGILAAGVIFTVILWAWSFWLSREYVKRKKLLLINGGAAVVLLALVPLLLHFTNLPSSMLPQYHITDFAHYSAEFSELFSVLRMLAENGSAAAEAAIRYADVRTTLFFVILGIGVLLGIAVIIVEALFSKERKKGRHAAWRKDQNFEI